jgi:hypothetical protein
MGWPRLARVRDLLDTRGRLSEARTATSTAHRQICGRGRPTAGAICPLRRTRHREGAYASARLSCDELAGQVMALQVRLGEAQAASIAQYDARRRAERIGVAGICVALACICAQVVWAVLS